MAVSIFWLGPNVLAAYKFTNLAFFFETWSAWLIFLVSLYETTLKGRVQRQMQYYEKRLKNSATGVEKFSFSRGRLFNLNCIFCMNLSVRVEKSVPFGIY